jgi:hypothetical protein
MDTWLLIACLAFFLCGFLCGVLLTIFVMSRHRL